MQYLYKYNEERRFIKGYNKTDMYISEPFKYKREGVVPESFLFSGLEVSKSEIINVDFN